MQGRWGRPPAYQQLGHPAGGGQKRASVPSAVAPMAARVVCGTGYVAIRGIQCRIWRRSGVLQRLRRRHSSPCLTTTRAARAAQTAGTAQEYHHQQSHRQTPARQRHIRVASILGVGGRRRRSDASERLPGGPAQPSPAQWESSGRGAEGGGEGSDPFPPRWDAAI